MGFNHGFFFYVYSSEKMLKMMEKAGVESHSSQQGRLSEFQLDLNAWCQIVNWLSKYLSSLTDPDASSHRDNEKLQASAADANTERQSG